MRTALVLPVHLVYLILSLLDDATPIHARKESINYHHLSSAPRDLYQLDNASQNWMLARRAEEIELDDDMALAICHPAGACQPCPKDLLQEPYCQPFGNRRLLNCTPAPSPGNTSADHAAQDPDHPSDEHPPPPAAGEGSTPHYRPSKPPAASRPAWESCGRLVPKERADFFEFVLCNVIFAALALAGVLVRSERMRVTRARRLAARIGVGLVRRASSGTWALGGLGHNAGSSGSGSSGGQEGEELMQYDGER